MTATPRVPERVRWSRTAVMPLGVFLPLFLVACIDTREPQRTAPAASYQERSFELRIGHDDFRVDGAAVSDLFFRSLEQQAYLGRLFAAQEFAPLASDDAAGTPGTRVMVISNELWREAFDGDPATVGRTVSLDGNDRTIVGVTVPGFEEPSGSHVWIPRR